MKRYLVTGAAGFIGSNFVHQLLDEDPDAQVVAYDALTYAGDLENLADSLEHKRLTFVRGDICDAQALDAVMAGGVEAVVNFAAETHVDRSIMGSAEFIRTNVQGVQTLLDAARRHKAGLFLQVSTDEVYGSLGPTGKFTEQTPYFPRSPYSASKAASDHFVRAYHHTYGLPVLITNCSNNYGPYQFPEKLVPLMVLNALAGKPLPVYGDGQQVRDWLFVEDHCRAIRRVLAGGVPGEGYNIGGDCERANLDVVKAICSTVDALQPGLAHAPCSSLITSVADRPGHDRRYAIDATKIRQQLGWRPQVDFASGLRKTVEWYLDHRPWIDRVLSGKYRLERLGLGAGEKASVES